MILLDDENAAETLRMMSYDGRIRNIPWANQNVEVMGYHYYMTPETAELGLEKFSESKARPARLCTQDDYPDLRTYRIFKDKT
jgi:dTDP-4-amino-4,6-dideoxygalactose transaminase